MEIKKALEKKNTELPNERYKNSNNKIKISYTEKNGKRLQRQRERGNKKHMLKNVQTDQKVFETRQ